MHYFCNLGNRRHHRFGNAVIGDIANETAVDFQGVNLKILQVSERTQTGAEIIQ
jgi:hypothetical protein